MLEQEKEFFDSQDPSSVWNTLASELKIAESQKEIFLAQKNKLGTQNDGIKNLVKKLKVFEKEILEVMKKRRLQMTQLTSLFTPTQQAKFMNWIEKNEACVHLLDNLWKKRTARTEVETSTSSATSTTATTGPASVDAGPEML